MRKLIILLSVLLAHQADAQESKLNYGIAIRPDSLSLVAAYDVLAVEDLFGTKGLWLKVRTLGGISNLGGSVSGGADFAIAGLIGKGAEGSIGIGALMLAGKKTMPCLTAVVKVFVGPSPSASSTGYQLLARAGGG